jgi:hypothetical protein
MTHGKPRDVEKERQWQRWIQQWRTSGLTIRAFCLRRGLSQPAFYRWRRVLADRGVRPRADADDLPLFVPVDLEPSGPTPTIEVLLPRGQRVAVRPGFDRATLAQVLAVREDPPC